MIIQLKLWQLTCTKKPQSVSRQHMYRKNRFKKPKLSVIIIIVQNSIHNYIYYFKIAIK